MQTYQTNFIQQGQQAYLISGTVDFLTVPGLMQQAMALLSKKNPSTPNTFTVDMSQVTVCNSAGLALMFELVSEARKNNIELQFENMPDSLQTIAKAYGIEKEIRDFNR
ncbi:MAG: STAS domain-containing protein [Gammaproteobacteria bacterium]|nr:STAS domain-containing protein [Gammaproteobacteria bacterium]